MICTTVRKNEECVFMAAKGCSYNGGSCHPVTEKCEGCKRTAEFESGVFCVPCPEPATKWKNGNCNLATHVSSVAAGKKQKINPIKASKRGH